MRVSSTQMIGRYQKQLNDSYEDQTKMMEQSDGSKLHRPSDDSVNYSKYLRYQNSSTENEQYQSNVKTGISWMKTADSAMVNMTDILTTLKEKTVQAATDTNGTVDVQAIGKEYLAKVYELVSLGNTQQGDRYMFSGQSDLTQPFTVSAARKDRGLTKTLDDPQAAFFGDEADSNGNVTQMLTLNGSDGQTYYLSTTTGNIYTKAYMDSGYKSDIANGYSTASEALADGKTTYIGNLKTWDTSGGVSDHYDARGVIKSGTTTKTMNVVSTTFAKGSVTETTDVTGDVTYVITDSSGNELEATLSGTTLTSKDGTVSITNYGGQSAIMTDGAGSYGYTDSNTNTVTVDSGSDWTESVELIGKYTTTETDSFVDATTSTDTFANTNGNVVTTTDANGNVTYVITDSNGVEYEATLTGTTLSSTDGTVYVTNYGTNTAVLTDSSANSPYNYANTTTGTASSNCSVKTTTDSSGNKTYSIIDSTGTAHDATLDKDGTTLTSNDGTVTVTGYGTSSAVLTDATGSYKYGSSTQSKAREKVEVSFETIKQFIVEYSGDAKHISMTKRNGTVDPTADTVNATGQDLFGSDIFDNVNSGNQPKGVSSGTAALNDLLTIVAKMEAGDVKWLSSDGITLADVAHSSVLDAQTTTAARQNVYDSVSTMLDKQNETITEDISNASDADVAKLAVMLMTMQTIYNMSLSVGSRILPQSLTDYLG